MSGGGTGEKSPDPRGWILWEKESTIQWHFRLKESEGLVEVRLLNQLGLLLQSRRHSPEVAREIWNHLCNAGWRLLEDRIYSYARDA